MNKYQIITPTFKKLQAKINVLFKKTNITWYFSTKFDSAEGLSACSGM